MRTYRRRMNCIKAMPMHSRRLNPCKPACPPVRLCALDPLDAAVYKSQTIRLLNDSQASSILAVILSMLLLLLVVESASGWRLLQSGPESFSFTQQVIAPCLDLGQFNLLSDP